MIDLSELITSVSGVLPSHVPMTRRADPQVPQDVLLEWRPEAEGASILDIGWEADGGDIQIGYSNGYFDLWLPTKGTSDVRLVEIVEYAEAISLGRLVTFSETERKMRTQTTVFGCRSGPRVHREHGKSQGAPDIYVAYAPW